jgi:hypothetical protein
MTEQGFPDDYEAPEADAADQSRHVDQERGHARAVGEEEASADLELPWEANSADAVEQTVAVPVDEDEYR